MSNDAEPGTSVRKRRQLTTRTRLALGLVFAILPGMTANWAYAQAPCTSMPVVRIQEWPGDIINIVPWVADAKGLFKKHCLDVKLVPLVGGPPSVTALVSGSLEFNNGAVDGIMRVRAQGVDIRTTANMYAGHWNALLARNGLALPHLKEGYPAIMKDLVGKKIGVTVLGGTTEAFVKSSFADAGMSPDSAIYIAVGGVNTAVPALKGGIVDAAMMFGTGPELAEALGAGKILLDYRVKGVGPASVQALWDATLSWSAYGPYIDKNPDTVAAFTRANNEAIAWIQSPQNRNELYRIVGARMPLPDTVPNREETLKRIIDVNAGLLGPNVPEDCIEGWNKYLLSLKQIRAPIPYNELIWKTAKP